jgi:hypothetical protein
MELVVLNLQLILEAEYFFLKEFYEAYVVIFVLNSDSAAGLT